MEFNNYINMSEDDLDTLMDNLVLSIEDEEKDKIKETEETGCINCKSKNLIKNSTNYFYVCQDCGVINKEYLDKNPNFNKDKSGNSQYGCPSNYFYPKSALGTKIKSRKYCKLGMLQRQGQMPYRERSLLEVLSRIQRKCKKYNITQAVIDNAKILYKKISDCKHKKGKSKGKTIIIRCINRCSLIAACVFYGCKLQNEPRSPKEIADIFDLEIKHVNRGCRKFLEFIDPNLLFHQIRCSQSSDFIDRFSKKLNIKKEFIVKAREVAVNIHKLDIASTHEPPSVAAGSLLLVSNFYKLDLKKREISDVFEISDVTISKTYRKIWPYHKIILNNDVTEKIYKRTYKAKKNVIANENLVKEITKKSKKQDSISDSESDSEELSNNNMLSINV